jgi:NTP pyrophosphatase (non-canonical NTP hydrolase)
MGLEAMQDTIDRIRRFRDDRGWLQFHNPKDLAMSISIEAAELLEHFQWLSVEQSVRHAAEHREAVSDEMADVAIYLLELADILKIDLAKAIDAKLVKNAIKYPVDKPRGDRP